MKRTILILIVLLLVSALKAVADPNVRFLRGADRCQKQYLKLVEQEQVSTSDLKLAKRYLRCLERYSLKREALAAKKINKKKIRKKIRAIKKRIRKLKRRASKVSITNFIKAGKLLDKALGLEMRVNRLKDRLARDKCTEFNSYYEFIFENRSIYEAKLSHKTSFGTIVTFANLAPGKTSTVSIPYSEIYPDSSGVIKLRLSATINGSQVTAYPQFNEKSFPKSSPCKRTIKWEVENNTFPAPAAEFFVFGVSAGPNLYIGVSANVEKRTPCSFANGGTDCSSLVSVTKLSSAYSSLEAAEKAFCSMVSQKRRWSLAANCQEQFMINGKWYWGCESSVYGAVRDYCPEYK